MREDCLTPPMVAVLEAVREGALAWSSSAELVEATGLEPTDVQTIADELVSMDCLVFWDGTYCLTLHMAEAFNVHIEDYGIIGKERWVPNDYSPHSYRRWRGREALEELDLAEDLVDPSPGPDAVAEAMEDAVAYVEQLLAKEFKRKRPLSCDGIEPPTLILVGPAIVWREAKSPDTCWRCKGRELRPWEFCLCCCRWGMDEYVKKGRRKLRA